MKGLFFILVVILLITSCLASNGGSDKCAENVCAGVRCKSPLNCKPLEVVCVRAPCCPIPTCHCGDEICDDDEKCVKKVHPCLIPPCPEYYGCSE